MILTRFNGMRIGLVVATRSGPQIVDVIANASLVEPDTWGLFTDALNVGGGQVVAMPKKGHREGIALQWQDIRRLNPTGRDMIAGQICEQRLAKAKAVQSPRLIAAPAEYRAS